MSTTTQDRSGDGRFKQMPHDEADVSLDGPATARSELERPAGPEECDDWTDRPVHDVMSQMAPDLVDRIERYDAGLTESPTDQNLDEYRADTERIVKALNAVEGYPFGRTEVVVEDGLKAMKRRTSDGKLDIGFHAAIAPTVVPAVKKFSQSPSSYPEYMTSDEWTQTLDNIVGGYEAARRFDSLQSSRYLNEVGLRRTRSKIDVGAHSLANHYTSLWS